MAKLINEDKASGDRTVRVPQFKLNAFPEEIKCYDEEKKAWEKGAFVIHFAGAWAHVEDKENNDPTGLLMRKYEKEIVWGKWEDVY